MKPTFQISRPARQSESRPVKSQSRTSSVQQEFQTTVPAFRGSPASPSPKSRPPKSQPHFWALSQNFFAVEARREDRLEALLFAIIVALAAWPIAFAFYMASETVR